MPIEAHSDQFSISKLANFTQILQHSHKIFTIFSIEIEYLKPIKFYTQYSLSTFSEIHDESLSQCGSSIPDRVLISHTFIFLLQAEKISVFPLLNHRKKIPVIPLNQKPLEHHEFDSLQPDERFQKVFSYLIIFTFYSHSFHFLFTFIVLAYPYSNRDLMISDNDSAAFLT